MRTQSQAVLEAVTAPSPISSTSRCDTRVLASAVGTELYITATPSVGGRGVGDMYKAIAQVLQDHDAAILEERLFGSVAAMAPALACRAREYGELDDGVMPTLLTPRCAAGELIGVQVHAIVGVGRPEVLSSGGVPAARMVRCNGQHYLIASGLRAAHLPGGPAQTQAVFQSIGELLGEAGGSLRDIARTWIWMDQILTWYPELNQVRSTFFKEHGLMDRPGYMPASTGIGVSPVGSQIGMDLFAAWGNETKVERFHAAGNQRSAYEYGSAFARASRVQTPGGVTVFCSGTAAIDAAGNTCHLDNGPGQVAMTIENVLAVLRDVECESEDVVQAMAYCATEEVRQHFLTKHAPRLPWPCLAMIGDVCRDNLLFEVEVTACPRARSLIK